MPTIRQVCSDIINGLSAKNIDDRISYRFIRNKLMDAATYFIKQDVEMRKLFKLSNLWKEMGCYDLVEVPYSECAPLGCKTLMKSIKQIPEVYETGYGYAVKVFNVDFSKEFKLIQSYEYKDISQRRFKSNNGYFWINDGYIYIPDQTLEVVIPLGMVKEDSILKDSECPKPLDSEFAFPEYIIKIAKDDVTKELLVGRQLPEDQNPNLNNKD